MATRSESAPSVTTYLPSPDIGSSDDAFGCGFDETTGVGLCNPVPQERFELVPGQRPDMVVFLEQEDSVPEGFVDILEATGSNQAVQPLPHVRW